MKKTMCCSVCKQDNISWRVWADELNNVNGSCEDKFVYCDNCEDQTIAIFKDNLAKFNVVNGSRYDPEESLT